MCRPPASPLQTQSPAGSWSLLFPGFNRKKKKEEKGRWPWSGGTGRGSGTIQAELPVRRRALRGVHAGWVTQSVLVSWVFSSLRPALDSQPWGLRQRPRSAGYRGAAVLEKTPAVTPLWRACPGTGGSSEFWPPVGCRVVNH